MKKLMLAFLAVSMTLGCSKDDDSKPADNLGSYDYNGQKGVFKSGDYRDVDMDGPWVFLKGEGFSDYIQFRFSGAGADVPVGTFTFNDSYYLLPTYDASKYFNGGNISSDAAPAGDEITGGSVTVSKSEGNYSIAFDVTTAKGALKGTYTGPLTAL